MDSALAPGVRAGGPSATDPKRDARRLAAPGDTPSCVGPEEVAGASASWAPSWFQARGVLSPPPWGRSSLWFLSWRLFFMTQSWLQRLLKRKSRPVSRTARKPFGRDRFLPNIEALDGRIVPSTFHVTTLADGGDGSLRAAVGQANAHPASDTVVFDDGLTGTIALTSGEIDITDDLKVSGPGADRLTVSGSNLSRVFQVEAGEEMSISGLTIAGGNAADGFGSGIDN